MRLEELPVGSAAKLSCGCRIERLVGDQAYGDRTMVRARLHHTCRWNKGRPYVQHCDPGLEVSYDPLADELELAFA